jgi:SAM-dependent methyltransferase
MPGLAEWQAIANTADVDELLDRIFTGYKNGKPFVPYVPTVPLPSSIDSLLDFGCGVGRSFPYLKSIARHVVGFDLEPMIERCRLLASQSIDLLSSNWDEISGRRFDLIFVSLVLQHIETDLTRAYLTDFAKMAPKTYLLTRLQNDFGKNVLGLVAASELFDIEECAEVEHDSEQHQLKQIGRRSFEEVSRAADNLHYEVVIKSRFHDR